MALSKNTIKFIRSLQQKKYRQKYNNFIAEGDKIVSEMLQQKGYPLVDVYAVEDWIDERRELLNPGHYNIHPINERELSQITQLRTPNKVVAVAGMPSRAKVNWEEGWSIYLDAIQDPGNLGTILRIADWFGIPRVIGGPGTADLYNAKTIQATMGAFLRVQFLEKNLAEIQEDAPDMLVYAADMNGTNVFAHDFPATGILVIGNEGQGISEEVRKLCKHTISIPAPAHSGAESLNAAVATGILCAVITNR